MFSCKLMLKEKMISCNQIEKSRMFSVQPIEKETVFMPTNRREKTGFFCQPIENKELFSWRCKCFLANWETVFKTTNRKETVIMTTNRKAETICLPANGKRINSYFAICGSALLQTKTPSHCPHRRLFLTWHQATLLKKRRGIWKGSVTNS